MPLLFWKGLPNNDFFRNMDWFALFTGEKTQWFYVVYHDDFGSRNCIGCDGIDCGAIGDEWFSKGNSGAIIECCASCGNWFL